MHRYANLYQAPERGQWRGTQHLHRDEAERAARYVLARDRPSGVRRVGLLVISWHGYQLEGRSVRCREL